MEHVVALGAFEGAVVLLALLATGSQVQRILVFGLSFGLLFSFSAVSEDHVGLRGLLALSSTIVPIRLWEVSHASAMGPVQRVWHLLGIVDTRRVQAVRPSVNWSLLKLLPLWLALDVLSLAAVYWGSTELDGPARLTVRWVGGGVFAYANLEAMVILLTSLYRRLGWNIPTIHNHPILSRSLSEFWGQRWNRLVSAFLREHFFRPFVRRGWRWQGMVCAFTASALIHAFFIWAALGLFWGALMGTFFLLQGVGVALERALRVSTWPTGLARVWTISWVALCSPLFVEPILQIFDSWTWVLN